MVDTMKFTIGDSARKLIRTLRDRGTLTDMESSYLRQWACEKNVVCAYLESADEIVSFCILHKLDFDPYGVQANPYLIDFIYTFPHHRGHHYAPCLLIEMTPKFETTAFLSNERSYDAFMRATYLPVSDPDRENLGLITMRSQSHKLLKMMSSGKDLVGMKAGDLF